MQRERTTWEEESAVTQPTAPARDSPFAGPSPKEEASGSSTSESTTFTRPDEVAVKDLPPPEDEKVKEHEPASPGNESQPTPTRELRVERSYHDAGASLPAMTPKDEASPAATPG